MKRVTFRPHLLAPLLFALMTPTLAIAHKPLTAKQLSAADPAMGYILVKVGPLETASRAAPPVGFVRLDPWTGQLLTGNKVKPDSQKEFDHSVAGGTNFLTSDGKTSLYLVPARPGTWVIASAGTTFYSLGTYSFEVRAGEVSNIGTILTGREDGKSVIPEIAAAKLSQDLVDFGTLMNIVMTNALLVRPPAGEPLPSSLTNFKVHHAPLQGGVRFDNSCRCLINRVLGLPPMAHESVRVSPSATSTQDQSGSLPAAVSSAGAVAPRKTD